MSIVGKIGRLFGGAVAESLTDQLRAKHLECEALKAIIRDAMMLDAMTIQELGAWRRSARKAVGLAP